MVALKEEARLLGSTAQLCAGFFHTDRCYEAETQCGAPVLCLAPSLPGSDAERERVGDTHMSSVVYCERKPTTVLILQVRRGEELLYVCRYTNCFKGSVADSQHAEQVR